MSVSSRVKTTKLHLSPPFTSRVLQTRPMIYLECDFKSAGNQHTRRLTLAQSTGPLCLNAGFHRYHRGLAFAVIYNKPSSSLRTPTSVWENVTAVGWEGKQKYLCAFLFQDYHELQPEDHPVSRFRPEPKSTLHVSTLLTDSKNVTKNHAIYFWHLISFFIQIESGFSSLWNKADLIKLFEVISSRSLLC